MPGMASILAESGVRVDEPGLLLILISFNIRRNWMKHMTTRVYNAIDGAIAVAAIDGSG